jgi:transposase
LKAYLVFIDESGFLLSPLVRRTWAPRGKTPFLYHRTPHQQKVSVIAALCVSPHYRKFRLYFRLYQDVSINTPLVKDFLYQLSRQINRPLIIIWDRLKSHRSRKVQKFILRTPNLYQCFFPPYAPELNPVEYIWSYFKLNPLANYSSQDSFQLANIARKNGRSIQAKQNLLRSFVMHSSLFCL